MLSENSYYPIDIMMAFEKKDSIITKMLSKKISLAEVVRFLSLSMFVLGVIYNIIDLKTQIDLALQVNHELLQEIRNLNETLENITENINENHKTLKEDIENVKKNTLSSEEIAVVETKNKLTQNIDTSTKDFILKSLFIVTCVLISGLTISSILNVNPIEFIFNKVVPISIQDFCRDNVWFMRKVEVFKSLDSKNGVTWIAEIVNNKKLNLNVKLLDGSEDILKIGDYLDQIRTTTGVDCSNFIKPVSSKVIENTVKNSSDSIIEGFSDF
jgi:hypothetical protein